MEQMPDKIHNILATSDVTVNFHRMCVTPTTFESNTLLNNYWNVISTNHDDNGTEFVSLFESKHYPMWGSQFHPEKNMYEWTPHYPGIPHFQEAVDVGTYFANFFVNQCRKSEHHFDSRQIEEKYLIYNYSPEYTGKLDIDWVMEQSYLFY